MRRASVLPIVTRVRIVTVSGTGRGAAIEIANGTAIPGARRHAMQGRAKEPANPAATAGRAARIATIAITVAENIAAKRVESMGHVPTDPVPMCRVPMCRVPMVHAAMPAAAKVAGSAQMCRRATKAAMVPSCRVRVNLASAPSAASAAAVGAGAVAADAARVARTPATDS